MPVLLIVKIVISMASAGCWYNLWGVWSCREDLNSHRKCKMVLQ